MTPYPHLPHEPPQIEMTVDGRMVDPPGARWTDRLIRYAVVAAAVAALLALAALAFWLAVIMIPLAFAAAAVAYVALRWRLWKLGGGTGFPFR